MTARKNPPAHPQGEGANPSRPSRPSRRVRPEVTPAARELARLVALKARNAEAAAALEDELPEIMAAVLHGASGGDASAVANRTVIWKLLDVPGLGAAPGAAGGMGATPTGLRAGLVAKLTGRSSPPRHAGATEEDDEAAKALPF